jgi:DNA polymerase (family 10)
LPVHNADIAVIFDEIADLLEIARENPFLIRAYRTAARAFSGTHRCAGALAQR